MFLTLVNVDSKSCGVCHGQTLLQILGHSSFSVHSKTNLSLVSVANRNRSVAQETVMATVTIFYNGNFCSVSENKLSALQNVVAGFYFLVHSLQTWQQIKLNVAVSLNNFFYSC